MVKDIGIKENDSMILENLMSKLYIWKHYLILREFYLWIEDLKE